jgi:hypothetical protein
LQHRSSVSNESRVIATLHKFVAIAAVPDHLRLGWMAAQALRGTYHGQYSVHMVWLCECKPLEPMLAKEQRHRVKAEWRATHCNRKPSQGIAAIKQMIGVIRQILRAGPGN